MLNTHTVAWGGVALVALTCIVNPQIQAAIVGAFSHPSAQSIVTLLAGAAGVVLTYLGRPVTVPKGN